MKILFYAVLELIFIIAVWFWGDLFLISMLKPGETCLTANYGINIGNYLELGWNNYFQWFSNIEQMPCRITFAAWCLYFISCFPAYALLKVYGMFKLSITLKYKFVISEYIFYIALFMIWLFLQPGLVLTSYSFINASIGVLLLFVPFILCSIFIISGCNIHIANKKNIENIKKVEEQYLNNDPSQRVFEKGHKNRFDKY